MLDRNGAATRTLPRLQTSALAYNPWGSKKPNVDGTCRLKGSVQVFLDVGPQAMLSTISVGCRSTSGA